MPDFRFDTEFILFQDDTEIVLLSIDDAAKYAPPAFEAAPQCAMGSAEAQARLRQTEQDAQEAAGALREFLSAENLLRAETTPE